MTKISKIRLDSKKLGFFINNFWNLVTLLEDKDQVASFLKDLLTHTEMKMLAKRIQIAKMLLEGHAYQTIRGYIRVTDPTISKISNKLETGGQGLKTAISYLQKIEEKIDKEKMRIAPDLKEKYPSYFLPERIVGVLGKALKKRRKKKSVSKYISL